MIYFHRIQAISYILSIRHVTEAAGSRDYLPFLVVSPLSTINNWLAEFKQWAPHLNVISYADTPEGRSIIEDLEFFPENNFTYYPSVPIPRGTKLPLKLCRFDVLVLTYQNISMNDVFSSLLWESIIIDEGHR